MNDSLRKVLKRLHYPLEVMLVCVRWYSVYPLSLRHLEEMMAERGIEVDHSTVQRWAVKILPVLAAVLRRRKRPVGTSWRMDETSLSDILCVRHSMSTRSMNATQYEDDRCGGQSGAAAILS